MSKSGIFVAKMCNYALIDSFQGTTAILKLSQPMILKPKHYHNNNHLQEDILSEQSGRNHLYQANLDKRSNIHNFFGNFPIFPAVVSETKVGAPQAKNSETLGKICQSFQR